MIAVMMKHRMSRTMTARKVRMMNDSYLTSMFYRIMHYGISCTIFKAVIIAKGLTRFW